MRKITRSFLYLLTMFVSVVWFLPLFKTSEAIEETTQTENIDSKNNSEPSTGDVVQLEKILIKGDRAYSTASSKSIRKFDLNIRPMQTAQDMLQLAPGLVVTQHAGGGKAEQIFLRGFDADHGTDVAISTDGIPVNMVSHGHGQGYADLHYVIPELVESIDLFKGPYFARHGNFSTAGSVMFRTKDYIDQSTVKIEGGEFNTQKATGLFQIPGQR